MANRKRNCYVARIGRRMRRTRRRHRNGRRNNNDNSNSNNSKTNTTTTRPQRQRRQQHLLLVLLRAVTTSFGLAKNGKPYLWLSNAFLKKNIGTHLDFGFRILDFGYFGLRRKTIYRYAVCLSQICTVHSKSCTLVFEFDVRGLFCV